MIPKMSIRTGPKRNNVGTYMLCHGTQPVAQFFSKHDAEQTADNTYRLLTAIDEALGHMLEPGWKVHWKYSGFVLVRGNGLDPLQFGFSLDRLRPTVWWSMLQTDERAMQQARNKAHGDMVEERRHMTKAQVECSNVELTASAFAMTAMAIATGQPVPTMTPSPGPHEQEA